MPTSPSTAETAAGRVVFLIDESAAMDTRVAEGTKSKADCVATALNSLLAQLGAAAELEVAVVGYRGEGEGGVNVGCRWSGPLAGRNFVRCEELPAAPAAIEQRVRKAPVPGLAGAFREETVPFPVWYAPRLAAPAPREAAFAFCRQLLAARRAEASADAKPDLLIHIVGDAPAETGGDGPVAAAGLADDGLLVFHAHLGASARVPPTLYPSSAAHLPPGLVQSLFPAASPLPEPLAAALRAGQTAVAPAARGMIVHARLADLIRFLSLVKAYAAWRPAPAAFAPPAVVSLPEVAAAPTVAQGADSPADGFPPDAQALIVLLLDRSVADPAAPQHTWARLQPQANELLAQIAKRGNGRAEVAAVAYGASADGQTEFALGLGGPLAGRGLIADAELADAALRVEQTTEKVSNGIGGLVEVTRKRPIYLDLPPTGRADVRPAIEAVGQLLSAWRAMHGAAAPPPAVLHFTRGQADAAALGLLTQAALLYHCVATESPHAALAYPDQPDALADPALRALWQCTSPLAGRRRLAAARRGLSPDARGLVVNARFDLLLDGLWQPQIRPD